MNIRPIGGNILVRLDKPKELTEGGLYIPETATDKPKTAVVVSTGSGKASRLTEEGTRLFEDIQVTEGDHVLLRGYAGTDATIDGEAHKLVTQYDILGIITG